MTITDPHPGLPAIDDPTMSRLRQPLIPVIRPALGTVLVLIPTLDEAENITKLLELVRLSVPAADVLVIDDGSTDGTRRRAEVVASTLGQIRVWHRPGPRGLGEAYRAGFALALAEGYGVVVQMDADLSHDPRHLGALVDAIGRGADVAIGSRYVPGGSTPGWPRRRRALSRAGGLYARTLLGLEAHDVTSGYRAYRSDILRTVDLSDVTSTGFGFQIDMTERVQRAGAKVVEVPIAFHDRIAGTSKISGRIVGEALGLVTRRALDRPQHP